MLWKKYLIQGHDGQAADARWLRDEATGAVVEQQLVAHWLKAFSMRLADAGQAVLLLKGAAFNAWLYPRDAPRRGVDIDLLARPSDFDAVEALLLRTHQAVTPDARRRVTHRRLFERMYRPRDKGGMVVELHRDLTNPYLYRIDHSEIWRDSRPHPGYATPALRIPASEHALLNLALHAARNGRFDDYGLLDAVQLARVGRPDWRKLVECARRWRAGSALYLLLDGVEGCWPGSIEAGALAALRPPRARIRLLRRLLAEPGGPSRARQLLWQYACSDHPLGVAAFQLDYAATRIGDALVALTQRFPR